MNGSRDAWIEVPDRVTAVALMQWLARRGSYLIQPSHDRWVVYARCDEASFDRLVADVDALRRATPLAVHWHGRQVVLPARGRAAVPA